MVAVVTGDAIPLLDDNGSGVYIKGRNNSHDHRAGWIGAIFATDATPTTYRQGVVARGIGVTDLQCQQNGGGGQNVLVKQGRCIIPRVGQGPYLWTLEADQVLAMPAASGAGTRIDIVCATLYDKGPFPGDASHGPELTVVSGTVGGGVPGTPAGSYQLAQVTRAANDNVISTAEILDSRQTTTLTGGIWYWGPGDILVQPAGTYVGQLRDSGTAIDRWTGTVWETVIPYFNQATGGGGAAYYQVAAQAAIATGTDTKIQFNTADSTDATVTAAGTGNQNFTLNRTGWWDISMSGRTDIVVPPSWLFYLAPSSSPVGSGRLATGQANGTFPAGGFSFGGRLTAGTQLSVYAYHEAGSSKLLSPEGKSLRVSMKWRP